MYSRAGFSPICKKCQCPLELDTYAIDTVTCQNKHTFLFKCPQCGGFNATAMANIPQDQWHQFVPEDQLDEIMSKYNAAVKKYN